MPAKKEALVWMPGINQWQSRRFDIENGALVDHVAGEARPVRLLKYHKVRYRSSLLPMKVIERQLPVLQDGDSEPLDLSRPEDHYRVAKPRVTREVRLMESRETVFRVRSQASSAQAAKSIWTPLIIGAELTALGAMAMIGWMFFQNNSVF